MARVKGTNGIIGTINGVNYYDRKGKPLARTAGGGFTAEAIKNSPNMAPVRKINSEFGHCSTLRSAFSEALRPFLCELNDGDLPGKLMKRLLEIKDLDFVNAKGQRQVAEGMQTQRGKYLLKEFVFTPKCRGRNHLGGTWRFDADRDVMVLEAYELDPKQFPKGATHLCLQVGRLHFDFATLEHHLVLSEPLLISPEDAQDPLEFPLERPKVSGMELLVLRLRFYQCFPGEQYPLSGERSKGVEVLGIEG
ncbi:MAG: hypothetical protein R2773_06980 [Flavobacteriaceae bacterium]